MSRDERQQKKTTDPRDFWWLQSPPRGGAGTPTDSSTPIDESEKQAKLSQVRGICDVVKLIFTQNG